MATALTHILLFILVDGTTQILHTKYWDKRPMAVKAEHPLPQERLLGKIVGGLILAICFLVENAMK